MPNPVPTLMVLATLALAVLAEPARAQPGGRGLEILEAQYGVGDRTCEATRSIQRQCEGQAECRFDVNNTLCGDPVRGHRKALGVVYSCGRTRNQFLAVFPEEAQGELYCRDGGDHRPIGAGTRNRLIIDRVTYGVGQQTCDATDAFARECDGRRYCEVQVGNELCGDPARNRAKSAEIHYRCSGRRMTDRVDEDRYAALNCR